MLYFSRYVLPVVMQIMAMSTDILLLIVAVLATLHWGIIGFIMAISLIVPGVVDTGGFFYSWRPSVIKAFFTEYHKNAGNKP